MVPDASSGPSQAARVACGQSRVRGRGRSQRALGRSRSASAGARGRQSTRQKRITTPFGYRSPLPTKTARMSHCSSGAAVSNFGTVRK